MQEAQIIAFWTPKRNASTPGSSSYFPVSLIAEPALSRLRCGVHLVIPDSIQQLKTWFKLHVKIYSYGSVGYKACNGVGLFVGWIILYSALNNLMDTRIENNGGRWSRVYIR